MDDPATAADSNKLGRNVAALGTAQLFTWTMTLAWTLVIARVLGPRGVGLITTAVSVTGALQILLGAGTGVYVAREIVVSPPRAARLVSSAAILRLLLAPVFLLAVFAWAQVAHYDSEGKLVIYLSGAATALYVMADPIQSYFQATERMHYLALSNAINKASQGLVGIVLTLLGFGAIGFAACWMVTTAGLLVLSIRWIRRHVNIEFKTTRRDLRDVARGTVVYWTAGVFQMIYLWIDTVMLSVMTSATVVGWYGVPTRLFQTMLFLPGLFMTAWLPSLIQAFQRSPADLREVARAPVELLLGLSLPIVALIAAAAAPAIRLVYGPEFAPSVPVLIILGVALIPLYLNMMLSQVCVAAGKQRYWTLCMVGATIFNPALNAVLIPLTQQRFGNGGIGAAVALLATETAIACAGVAITGPGVVGRQTVTRLLRTGIASVGLLIVAFGLRDLLGDVVSLALGVVTFAVLAVAVGAISPEERRQVGARVGGIWRRVIRRLRPSAGASVPKLAKSTRA
jgi:O-antigen/teichoic acid export membrane protein